MNSVVKLALAQNSVHKDSNEWVFDFDIWSSYSHKNEGVQLHFSDVTPSENFVSSSYVVGRG